MGRKRGRAHTARASPCWVALILPHASQPGAAHVDPMILGTAQVPSSSFPAADGAGIVRGFRFGGSLSFWAGMMVGAGSPPRGARVWALSGQKKL